MGTSQINSNLISALEWRYATKKFDPKKKVAEGDIQQILRAVQLAASSYGFQPYKVFVVSDPELKARLHPAAYNQPQVLDCSHVFVFAHYLDFSAADVRQFLQRKAEVLNVTYDKMEGAEKYLSEQMAKKPSEAMKIWTSRQAYIALGNLLAACGELRIDACPMEGFKPDEFGEILGLPQMGLKAVVMATVGYRSEEDKTQFVAKVRRSIEDLFVRL